MCFVSGEKVRSPVRFVTFPESAVCRSSLRESSLEREVTSLIAKRTQYRGERVFVGGGGGPVVMVVGGHVGLVLK